MIMGSVERERLEASESAASILLFGHLKAARLCGAAAGASQPELAV
jgi:hypothetical protein